MPDDLHIDVAEQARRELEHARWFNEHLMLPEQFDEWLDELTHTIMDAEGKKKTKQNIFGTRNAISALIANLLNASAISNEGWVVISSDNNNYSISRYKGLCISYKPLMRVLNYMKSDDSGNPIIKSTFFNDRVTGVGRISRYKMSELFYNFFFVSDKNLDEFIFPFQSPPIITNSTSGFPVNLLTLNPSNEFIRLKDENKRLIDYQDNDVTNNMRGCISEWNVFSDNHHADIFIPDKSIRTLLCEDDSDNHHFIDFNRRHLYRVFNNESFDQGGRFYGGWWQSVPGKYRRFITINGERTVEIDFSTMQASMLYAREGMQLPTDKDYDAYALDGLENNEDNRDNVKRAYMKLINSRADQPLSAEGIGDLPEGWSFDRLIEGLQKKHEPISMYFRTGVGLEIQRQDSKIVEQVLLRSMGQGELVLPIHDPFIARKAYSYRLRDIMHEAYAAVMGLEIAVDIDTPFPLEPQINFIGPNHPEPPEIEDKILLQRLNAWNETIISDEYQGYRERHGHIMGFAEGPDAGELHRGL